MLNLLSAERIKLRRSKKLIIALIILCVLPIIQTVNSYWSVSYGAELVQKVDTVVNGATGILMIKKNGLTVLLVMSAFISFFIGEEFQHGTIRNALSLGRSRTHYYVSKLIVVALVSLAGVIVMTILGMIGFTIAFGFGGVAEMNHYVSYALKAFSTLYMLVLANVSVYVAIGFITKNSSFTLIWSFIYTIATGFLPGIFQQTTHFKQVMFWFTETFMFYFNFATPEDVARFPEMIVVSLITIVLSSAVGIWMFNRTDIK
ncbi:ABC transporter permease [Sporosarcina ureilytica]|uniref:ABC transporter permease n=1 Tax=Sporosarcina ureilytica TaxID=298596 RepID=A0A1D8JJN1_9BACL|nr:ABC transporter permease [Sporosarcina ureilytica]AOV08902.1 ABC transporter permease [Sporosarcina ureilytica]